MVVPVLVVPVLEIGGTHVTAAAVDVAAGRVLRQQRAPLDSNGSADAILATLAAAGLDLGPAGPHWGVAIPGPFDYQNGIGRFEDVGKFDSLAGVDLGAALASRLGPGTHPHFVNDADAFGLGEARYGAGQGHRRCVCVTVGTGVGSAFVADGRPVNDGPDVPPDGSVHLLSWAGRPLEETVSARAIRRRYAQASGVEREVDEIAELARRGDPAATGLRECFVALGACLAPWVTRFRATSVVLGGSIAESFDLIEGPLREGLGPDIVVLPAALPSTSALLGAAHHAAEQSKHS